MSRNEGGSLLPLKRSLQSLPAARDFVRYPASWYLLCAASELKKPAIKKTLLGRKLVIFRGASGEVVAMDGRCSHLGADLSHGQIVGDTISCPFHGWRYDGSGHCVHIPGGTAIPSFARQAVFPIEERHGLLFIFNGTEALFPLPFFFQDEPADFVAAQATEFVAETSWYMVAAHGYDLQHFATVHGRRLVTPLAVDCPSTFARRSRYRAEIAGASAYDSILRHVLNRQVSISITTWGGTLVLISGDFGAMRSQFLISIMPVEEQRSICSVVVFSRRGANRLARWLYQPISLALRKSFTRGYLVDEAAKLGQPRYLPQHLIAADRELIDYFCWVARLPQSRSALASLAQRGT